MSYNLYNYSGRIHYQPYCLDEETNEVICQQKAELGFEIQICWPPKLTLFLTKQKTLKTI